MRDSPFLCLLYVVLMALALTAPAQSRHLGTNAAAVTYKYQVLNGCPQPADVATGTTYYVKPAGSGGSDAANGLTLGTAWATPAHAEATMNIAGGDQVLMETGSYGSWNPTRNFSGFTYFKADTGQTPLFTTILVNGSASHMVFEGLKDQLSGAGFNDLWDVVGASNSIVLYGNDVSSASKATATGWTKANWDQSGGTGLVSLSGIFVGSTAATPCISVVHNTLYVVYIGISVAGTVSASYNASTLIADNTVDWFSLQALGYAGHNIQLSRNFVSNSADAGNASLHTDFILGGVGNCPDELCTYHDIQIDANTFYENWINPPPFPTSPTSTSPSPEALVAYDEAWLRKKVFNNVVVGGGPDLIEDASCTDCDFIDNVAINQPVGTIHGFLNINDRLNLKSPTSSSNVTVRNNAVSNLSISCNFSSSCQSTFNVDHNYINTQLGWWPSGSNQNTTTPGTYGTGNTISNSALTTWFRTYVPGTPAYDFRPFLVTSPLLANGALPASPCPDGTARGAGSNPNPPDQGAYC